MKMLSVLLMGISIQSFAQQDGSLILSLAGVISDQVQDIGDNDSTNNTMEYGGGALVESNIYDILGLETGALLINRHYDVNADGNRVVQEVRRLHIPLVLRIWPVDFFSLGAGPYAAIRTGNAKTLTDTTNGTVDTSASDRMEYGLDGAATFKFPINNKTGVFVEGRYSAALGGPANQEADDLSGLAGLKVDI